MHVKLLWTFSILSVTTCCAESVKSKFIIWQQCWKIWHLQLFLIGLVDQIFPASKPDSSNSSFLFIYFIFYRFVTFVTALHIVDLIGYLPDSNPEILDRTFFFLQICDIYNDFASGRITQLYQNVIPKIWIGIFLLFLQPICDICDITASTWVILF